MRWQNRRKSDNVVNRRGESSGSSGGLASGGLIFLAIRFIFSRFGIGGIVILVVAFFALQAAGVDPLRLLMGAAPQTAQVGSGSSQPNINLCVDGDQTDQFVCVVLASTEDVWNAEFRKRGQTYEEPKLNLFSGGVQAGACGYATSAVGPFYCPATREVYLDTGFFKELSQRFGASGDFAQAYVIAHEVGHHIQTITGVSEQVHQAKLQARSSARAQARQNELQVMMELQADCLAGVWAYHENNMFTLEPGDLEEALTAANAIGDDTLQRQAGRTPMPDSFTHGTSEQRKRWFRNGFDSGQMEDCDTFNAAQL
ncbi:MAG: zinc metallopeptidase [Aquisalinus sp.]|nr:zinc metallopeptidase [Aquisalinus sp.]